MNGIIVLGGVVDSVKETIKIFDCPCSVIRTHVRIEEDPFVVHTAAMRLAARLSSDRLVIITSSWIDQMAMVLGSTMVKNMNPAVPNYSKIREFVDSILLARTIDRMILRHGATYLFTSDAMEMAEIAFPMFRQRPGVVELTPDTDAQSVLIPASMWKSVVPDVSVNFNGNVATGRILFVGDQINPVFNHFNHWPFHAISHSARFMTSCMHEAMISEEMALWTNANHTDVDEREAISAFLSKNDKCIVALGNNAVEGLAAVGVAPHFKIPHPQWAKRFNKRDEYVRELVEIRESI